MPKKPRPPLEGQPPKKAGDTSQDTPRTLRKARPCPPGTSKSNCGRDATGLTAKQQLALPIIATAITPAEGIRECVKLGILKDETNFYKTWWRDERFRDAYNAARQGYLGVITDRIVSIYTSKAEEIAMHVVATAMSNRPDKLRAADQVMKALGVAQPDGSVTVNNNLPGAGRVAIYLPAKDATPADAPPEPGSAGEEVERLLAEVSKTPPGSAGPAPGEGPK